MQILSVDIKGKALALWSSPTKSRLELPAPSGGQLNAVRSHSEHMEPHKAIWKSSDTTQNHQTSGGQPSGDTQN